MSKNKTCYQQSYTARQKDRGLVAIKIWVPADRVAEVKDFAADLRDVHLGKKEDA